MQIRDKGSSRLHQTPVGPLCWDGADTTVAGLWPCTALLLVPPGRPQLPLSTSPALAQWQPCTPARLVLWARNSPGEAMGSSAALSASLGDKSWGPAELFSCFLVLLKLHCSSLLMLKQFNIPLVVYWFNIAPYCNSSYSNK